jgi:DNA-binding transcriptional MerR regulator
LPDWSFLKMADNSNTPSKLYYSISEVAEITDVKAHVLRYWESEFPTLKPRKTRTGSRRYRPADIEDVQAIKELLYEQGFKIAGARKVLRQGKQKAPAPEVAAAPQLALRFEGMDGGQRLAFLKNELQELQAMIRALESGAAEAPVQARKAEA